MQDFFRNLLRLEKPRHALLSRHCGAQEGDCTTPERSSHHVQQHVQARHRSAGLRARDVRVGLQTPATPRANTGDPHAIGYPRRLKTVRDKQHLKFGLFGRLVDQASKPLPWSDTALS